ncbi:MAG TPA: hypothetical protein VFB03_01745 [Candidatus Saccharimonadales bacterium]|nr:hypothetical protein [Candidatus Saccharimonadales bacterium]
MTEKINGPGKGEIRRQWYQDAGVGRGVEADIARDLGYRPPEEITDQTSPSQLGTVELGEEETAAARRVIDRSGAARPQHPTRANEVRLAEVEKMKQAIWPEVSQGSGNNEAATVDGSSR